MRTITGSLRIRSGVVGIALALIAGLASGPLAAQQDLHDAAQVEESRERVLSGGAYQTEKPQPEEREQTEPFTLPPWLAWVTGIALAGLVLFFLFNLLLELRGGRSALRRTPDKAPAEAVVVETPVTLDRETRQRSLAEADALAAEGRYTEAIHLLLLVAMERLRQELGPRVAPTLTSREILKLAPIPQAVLEPLARMVALTEIKHFGGRAGEAADYQACRRDFLHFSGGEPQRA